MNLVTTLPPFSSSALISLAVCALVVLAWSATRVFLVSHQTQVDAIATQVDLVTNARWAEVAVRAAETDPAVALAPGSAQRAWAVALTREVTSLPEGEASALIDAAYHGLRMAGLIMGAAPAPAPRSAPAPVPAPAPAPVPAPAPAPVPAPPAATDPPPPYALAPLDGPPAPGTVLVPLPAQEGGAH